MALFWFTKPGGYAWATSPRQPGSTAAPAAAGARPSGALGLNLTTHASLAQTVNRYFQQHPCDDAYYRSLANRPLPKNKTSRFRGVQKNGDPAKPFRVAFTYNRKRYYIGAYDNELEAARVYN